MNRPRCHISGQQGRKHDNRSGYAYPERLSREGDFRKSIAGQADDLLVAPVAQVRQHRAVDAAADVADRSVRQGDLSARSVQRADVAAPADSGRYRCGRMAVDPPMGSETDVDGDCPIGITGVTVGAAPPRVARGRIGRTIGITSARLAGLRIVLRQQQCARRAIGDVGDLDPAVFIKDSATVLGSYRQIADAVKRRSPRAGEVVRCGGGSQASLVQHTAASAA